MRERLHVPFHSLAGSQDEDDAPHSLLEQAETELSGDASTCLCQVLERPECIPGLLRPT